MSQSFGILFLQLLFHMMCVEDLVHWHWKFNFQSSEMPRIAGVIPFSDLTSNVNHYDMTYLLLNCAWIVCYSLVEGRHLTLRSVQPLLCVWIPLISLARGIRGRALEVPFSPYECCCESETVIPKGGLIRLVLRSETK